MSSPRRTGRIVGVLLLAQLAFGLTLPFILMGPVMAGSPAFLTAAAESSSQIRAAVFLAFVGGALTVALAIAAFPAFRAHSDSAARWFLSVCILSCALDFVHNATVMSMLSLSQEYAGQGAADLGRFELVGFAVASARRWAHVSQLLAIGMWVFVFYATLARFALVPRALAAVGLVGILLQFSGVTVMLFLGRPTIGEMAMPMLPIQIAAAAWLIAKGFSDRPSA
jgi:Domain of unknown function (DUF4386)